MKNTERQWTLKVVTDLPELIDLLRAKPVPLDAAYQYGQYLYVNDANRAEDPAEWAALFAEQPRSQIDEFNCVDYSLEYTTVCVETITLGLYDDQCHVSGISAHQITGLLPPEPIDTNFDSPYHRQLFNALAAVEAIGTSNLRPTDAARLKEAIAALQAMLDQGR